MKEQTGFAPNRLFLRIAGLMVMAAGCWLGPGKAVTASVGQNLEVRILNPDGTVARNAEDATIGYEAPGAGGLWSGSADRRGWVIVPFSSLGGAAGQTADLDIVVRAHTGFGEMRLSRYPRAPITLRLQPGAELLGTVLDGRGKPAPGVNVRVVFAYPGHRSALQFAADSRTDRVGRIRVPHQFPGRYAIRVDYGKGADRYHVATLTPPSTRVVITPGDPTTLPRPLQGQLELSFAPAPPH